MVLFAIFMYALISVGVGIQLFMNHEDSDTVTSRLVLAVFFAVLWPLILGSSIAKAADEE